MSPKNETSKESRYTSNFWNIFIKNRNIVTFIDF